MAAAPADEVVTIDLTPASSRSSALYPAGKIRADSATSLWRAAEHGDVGRLKMLLDAGHDVNALCDDKTIDTRCRSVLSAAVDGNEQDGRSVQPAVLVRFWSEEVLVPTPRPTHGVDHLLYLVHISCSPPVVNISADFKLSLSAMFSLYSASAIVIRI